VAIGNVGGAGSPIIVTSSTNTLLDAIPGVKLTLKKTTIPGEQITVTTDIDTSAIKDKINAFIKSYNDVKSYIDKQNRYDKDTTETGVLFGESSLFSMQETLSRAITSTVSGLDSKYKQLATIGIRTGLDGKLVFREPAKLEEALRADPEALIKLLGSAGSSTSSKIEFVSSTEKTKAGIGYVVDIISAATKGRFQAINIANPGSTPLTLTSINNSLKLVVNSTESDYLVLEAKTYGSTAELVEEIQSKINADAKIGSFGLTVSWVPSSDTMGHLEFTSSTSGSSSKVNLASGVGNSAFAALGMPTGQSVTGLDVQGTINGEKAEGSGQFLTGKAGNKTTDGLKLKVSYGTFEVLSGEEGKVTITKGVASRLAESLDSFTKSTDGFVDRRISSYQKQIESLKDRVKQFDALLVLRKESLVKKFSAMESALGQLNATNTFLTNAVNGLSANYINSK
jgi:flagellar hook-associated protein 2